MYLYGRNCFGTSTKKTLSFFITFAYGIQMLHFFGMLEPPFYLPTIKCENLTNLILAIRHYGKKIGISRGTNISSS